MKASGESYLSIATSDDVPKRAKVQISPQLPELNISKEQANKLDDLTKFTHQFLKFGEKKNMIPRNDQRLSHTIQLANYLTETDSALTSHRLKVRKKESNFADSTNVASRDYCGPLSSELGRSVQHRVKNSSSLEKAERKYFTGHRCIAQDPAYRTSYGQKVLKEPSKPIRQKVVLDKLNSVFKKKMSDDLKLEPLKPRSQVRSDLEPAKDSGIKTGFGDVGGSVSGVTSAKSKGLNFQRDRSVPPKLPEAQKKVQLTKFQLAQSNLLTSKLLEHERMAMQVDLKKGKQHRQMDTVGGSKLAALTAKNAGFPQGTKSRQVKKQTLKTEQDVLVTNQTLEQYMRNQSKDSAEPAEMPPSDLSGPKQVRKKKKPDMTGIRLNQSSYTQEEFQMSQPATKDSQEDLALDPKVSSQNFVFQVNRKSEEASSPRLGQSGSQELANIQHQLELQNQRLANISSSLVASIRERDSSHKKSKGSPKDKGLNPSPTQPEIVKGELEVEKSTEEQIIILKQRKLEMEQELNKIDLQIIEHQLSDLETYNSQSVVVNSPEASNRGGRDPSGEVSLHGGDSYLRRKGNKIMKAKLSGKAKPTQANLEKQIRMYAANCKAPARDVLRHHEALKKSKLSKQHLTARKLMQARRSTGDHLHENLHSQDLLPKKIILRNQGASKTSKLKKLEEKCFPVPDRLPTPSTKPMKKVPRELGTGMNSSIESIENNSSIDHGSRKRPDAKSQHSTSSNFYRGTQSRIPSIIGEVKMQKGRNAGLHQSNEGRKFTQRERPAHQVPNLSFARMRGSHYIQNEIFDGSDPKSKLVLTAKREMKQVSNSVHDNARKMSSQLYGFKGGAEWEKQHPYPQGANRAQVLQQARDHSKLMEKQFHSKKVPGLEMASPSVSGTALKKYPIAQIPLLRHKSPRSRALQNLSPQKKKSLYEKHHFGLSNNRVNLSPLDHVPTGSAVYFSPNAAAAAAESQKEEEYIAQNQKLRPSRRDSTVRNQELLKKEEQQMVQEKKAEQRRKYRELMKFSMTTDHQLHQLDKRISRLDSTGSPSKNVRFKGVRADESPSPPRSPRKDFKRNLSKITDGKNPMRIMSSEFPAPNDFAKGEASVRSSARQQRTSTVINADLNPSIQPSLQPSEKPTRSQFEGGQPSSAYNDLSHSSMSKRAHRVDAHSIDAAIQQNEKKLSRMSRRTNCYPQPDFVKNELSEAMRVQEQDLISADYAEQPRRLYNDISVDQVEKYSAMNEQNKQFILANHQQMKSQLKEARSPSFKQDSEHQTYALEQVVKHTPFIKNVLLDDDELRLIQDQITHDYESPSKGLPKSCAISEVKGISEEKRGRNGGQDVVDCTAKAYDD